MTEQRERVRGNIRGLPLGSWQLILAFSLQCCWKNRLSVCYINICVGREIAAAFLLFNHSGRNPLKPSDSD